MWGRVWSSIVVVAVLGAAPARAQTAQQQPPPAPAPPGSQGPPSTAGSQGQSSSAQPSSPGASSQQVVVNPPQPVPPTPPASSTTVVNPPPAPIYTQPSGDPGAERRRERPNPLGTVAMDGAYGGVAGLLVGGGVALIERDNWGRDLAVGTGLGLIVGAAVGVVQAVYESQQPERAARAREAPPRSTFASSDGQGRTDRDPVLSARTVGFGFRF